MWLPVRNRRLCLVGLSTMALGLLCGVVLSKLLGHSHSHSRRATHGTPVPKSGSSAELQQQQQQQQQDGRGVRVLCWIMTQPKNYASKARAVNATWAPRCDGYFFFSSLTATRPPPGLPIVAMNLKEDRDNLWDKTQAAFIHIYEKHLNDYDFFLKADDDSYIVVDNLRHFLRNTKPSEPIFAGRRFRPYTKKGYMSGGGSYVLSRAAVKAFVEKALRADAKSSACRKHGGAEDVNMGVCLENVGVEVLDSLDSQGRERFHPFDAASHIDFASWPKDFWLWKYNYHPIKVGLACCSSTAISFHYVKPADMLTLHYLIYQLRAYGVAPDSAAQGASGVPLHSEGAVKGRA